MRELIERYRPSVLWNDISWPAPAARLAAMLEAYYRAVPDGVVNDRFMPWSPAWELARTAPARRLLDRLAARSAAADKGIVPPKPPMFDVRTPEYTVFDSVQPTPWECVRGIDRSFGHNEQSREELFLGRAELVWSLTDIVAKGGNLLLNVGPRGVDATIAEAQTRRLDWLADVHRLGRRRPVRHPALGAPGRRRPRRRRSARRSRQVRYTARDRTVFAIVRQPDLGSVEGRSAPVVAPDAIVATDRATRTAARSSCCWPRWTPPRPPGSPIWPAGSSGSGPTVSGLTVWITERPTEEEPVVVALHDVRARPTS